MSTPVYHVRPRNEQGAYHGPASKIVDQMRMNAMTPATNATEYVAWAVERANKFGAMIGAEGLPIAATSPDAFVAESIRVGLLIVVDPDDGPGK